MTLLFLFFIFITIAAGYTVLTESINNLMALFVGGLGIATFLVAIFIAYSGLTTSSDKSKSA